MRWNRGRGVLGGVVEELAGLGEASDHDPQPGDTNADHLGSVLARAVSMMAYSCR